MRYAKNTADKRGVTDVVLISTFGGVEAIG